MALIAAVFVAGFLGGFTDWLFMGVLYHDAYNTFPEVWRPQVRAGKSRGAIIWSSLLGFVVSAAVVALCALASVRGIAAGLGVALIAWVGPAAVVVISNMFVKIDHRITVAHCLGYLARFVIAGAAAGIALS
jgi:hypothetical protein